MFFLPCPLNIEINLVFFTFISRTYLNEHLYMPFNGEQQNETREKKKAHGKPSIIEMTHMKPDW